MCNLLFALFGRDTRGAQVLNFILSLWWFVVIALTGMGVTNFGLPTKVLVAYENFASLFMVSMVTAAFAFTTCHRPKQVLKAAALTLGMLNQSVLANAYLTEYPPLDMMMCVSTVLALYFGFAVLYVFKCEGMNGDHLQR